jgi:hypothetical protein
MKIRGKAVYLKVYTPDEYNGQENWKAGLTVTKETYETLREAGCQLRKKFAEGIDMIDEGTPFVTFKRPVEKKFNDETVNFCPPQIFDKDGEKMVSYEVDGKVVRQFKDGEPKPEQVGEPKLIGNGSDIEITISLYNTKSFGKGTRLESIRVIDLIEYTPPEDDEKDGDEEPSEKKEEEPEKKGKKTKLEKEIGW